MMESPLNNRLGAPLIPWLEGLLLFTYLFWPARGLIAAIFLGYDRLVFFISHTKVVKRVGELWKISSCG